MYRDVCFHGGTKYVCGQAVTKQRSGVISEYVNPYMARASIKRAMTHRQFKWLTFCSINSYAHINTSKAVNN